MDGTTRLDDELEPELVLPAVEPDGGDPEGELVLTAVHRGERALLEAVTRALSLYVRDRHPGELFQSLLADLLQLTDSHYGYIGEVLHDEAGDPFLRTWAVTDISWNAESRALYDEFAVRGGGLEFRNLDTLFGWGLRDGGRLVIANDTGDDPRAAGLPLGHPPLDSYLGVPLFRSGQLIGQFGLANRPGGYDDGLVEWLEPFSRAIANLIEGHRVDRERIEAQVRLAASEVRLNSILSGTADIVTVLMPDGTWVSSSAEGTRSLGYPLGYDPEGGIFSLLHPDDVEPALRALDEVIAGTRTREQPIELRVRTAHGDYRVLETAGQDLRHESAVGGVVLTSRDVTERKHAEEQLRAASSELHALVSSLRDGVLFVDDRRRVVFVNDTFCRIFGYGAAPEDLVGCTTDELRGRVNTLLADPATFFAGVERRYADHTPAMSETVRFRDGRVFERDYLPVDFDEGDSHGHLWTYRDVTERSMIEAQRTRMLQSEREIRAAMEEQNRALRELDEMKNEFVATVSHELRTPLTSIVSFSSLLMEGAQQLDDEQREFLEIIDRNAERLMHLVSDLLFVARLDSGAVHVEPVPSDLGTLVTAATDAVRAIAVTGGVDLQIALDPSPAPALVDRGRFDQVLGNLLSNAVKFTPAHGSVTVTTERGVDRWLIEVADTGIGIPEEERELLFERFFRGSNARREQLPGTGLGLVISKAIVELHGGELRIESNAAGGTTAVLVLPDPTGALT